MDRFTRSLVEYSQGTWCARVRATALEIGGHLGGCPEHEVRRFAPAQADEQQRLGHQRAGIGSSAERSRIRHSHSNHSPSRPISERDHPGLRAGVEVEGGEPYVRRLEQRQSLRPLKAAAVASAYVAEIRLR